MRKFLLPALGIACMLIGLFGADIAGFRLGLFARIVLLLAGLVAVAFAIDRLAGARIGAHLAEHRAIYAVTARSLSYILTAALVLLAYVFFITLGTWTSWPPTTDYYDRLATALRIGHVYVAQPPDPALLALPNPYDPELRKGIPGLEIDAPGTIWDMALYNGRIYLYWGPAPALVLLGLKAAVPGVVGDQYVTFASLVGSFLFGALILLRFRYRYFPDAPAWTGVAGLLLLGLANPIPWLLFSPRIYESAIAAGQFFLMCGLYLAFSGLDRDPVSRWRLALAAVAWVAAVGSRATLVIAVAYLSIMITVWLLRGLRAEGLRASAWRALVAFGLPLLLGATLLAAYNYVRFGSFPEFGFRYEITMLDQNKYHDVLFSPSYLGPNAFLYLFNPPSFSSQFPFIKPLWNGDYVLSFNARYHAIYNAERIVGLIYAAPFLLFALIPPASAVARLFGNRRRSGAPPGETQPESRFFRWFMLTLSGLGLLQLLAVFVVFYATMRYFMDAAPTLVILSMLGFWLVYRRLAASPRLRWGFALAAAALLLFTVVMGILVGFSSDVPRLKLANPALLTHLKLFFMALARRLGL